MIPQEISRISDDRIEQAIRARYSPLPDLTMDLVSSQLNQFRIGELRPAARTWEIMLERDLDLAVPYEKAREDVARLKIQVEPVDDSAEAEQHAAALQYFYDHLTATSVLEQDEVGGAELLLLQMMSALAHRYSAHELILQVSNAGRREVTAEFRHCPVWFFEARRGKLGFLRQVHDVDGEPLQRGQWLVNVMSGWMRQCSVGYVTKHLPLRDWLWFCSRFGLPGIHGKTDAKKGTQEWNDFADALVAFANGWITQTSTNANITLVEASKGGGGTLPFADIIGMVNRGFASAFRGGDLSTQSRTGDSVGASLQDEEKDLLLGGRCKRLTGALNAGVDEPVLRWLFSAEPKAWASVVPPKRVEADREIKAMEFLTKNGGQVSVQEAHDRLQVPRADDTEDVLKAPTPPTTVPNNEPGTTNSAAALANESGDQAELAAALAEDLAPVRGRLEMIGQLTDPEAQRLALRGLLHELPELTVELLRDPAAAAAFEQVLGRALAEGLRGEAKPKESNA